MKHFLFSRSSNSIDRPHSKRDSAYSSFSTSSSIPDYLAPTPSFTAERSYSLETVPQRGGGSAEMLKADVHHICMGYDIQQGFSLDHKLSSTSTGLLNSSSPRGGVRSGLSQNFPGNTAICYFCYYNCGLLNYCFFFIL